MTRTFLMTAVAALALTGCSESDPSLNEVGATPDLPAVNETLIPPMKIAEPAGWNGGRHGGGAVPGRIGAAYSVAKGPVAVTVFTNQDESVKAEAVAKEAIANLGL